MATRRPIFAAQNGHLEIERYLVTAGSDVNVAAQDGSTPLYVAAESVHFYILKYLATLTQM